MSARGISRRNAAAGGLAMLVLAAAAAGQAKAEELDGALLRGADEMLRLKAEDERLRPGLFTTRPEEEEAADALYDYCDARIWGPQEEIVEQMTNTPACTPEGLLAKARVLEAWLVQHVTDRGRSSFEEEATDYERLALSIAHDIIGRALA